MAEMNIKSVSRFLVGAAAVSIGLAAFSTVNLLGLVPAGAIAKVVYAAIGIAGIYELYNLFMN